MSTIHKKIIIFDLDGTLAESKQPVDAEMSRLIDELLKEYMVAVISGGTFTQFEKQFLPNLVVSAESSSRLFILPTSGTTMYRCEGGEWEKIYSEDIPEEERKSIISAVENAIQEFSLAPAEKFGDLIEDRITQISYSGLGQLAPLDLKSAWDPDGEKRKKVIQLLEDKFPDYLFSLGGISTIDITKKGRDKEYGIRQIGKILDVSLEDMIFVGDATYEGGNDYPAVRSGVDCIGVSDVQDTKRYIRSILPA